MPLQLHTLGHVRESGREMHAICHNVWCRHHQVVDLKKVIDHVGSATPLLPQKGREHFSERMRCPRCKQRGMFIWLDDPKDPTPFLNEMRAWEVNELTQYGTRHTIAMAINANVAAAAMDAAKGEYPKSDFIVQKGWWRIAHTGMRVVKGGKG